MKKLFFLIIILLIMPFINSLENKQYPEKYNIPITNALQKYPELENSSISFIEKDLNKRTMYSKPTPNFLFLPREKHQYKIIINNKYKNTSLVLENFSESGQIGLIGHELGHIIDYQNKTDIQIIWTGIKYIFSKKYQEKLEKSIDRIAIHHGLKNEIYEEVVTMYNNKNYWKNKEGIYYTPQEILEIK